jgi:hypothetical protein
MVAVWQQFEMQRYSTNRRERKHAMIIKMLRLFSFYHIRGSVMMVVGPYVLSEGGGGS